MRLGACVPSWQLHAPAKSGLLPQPSGILLPPWLASVLPRVSATGRASAVERRPPHLSSQEIRPPRGRIFWPPFASWVQGGPKTGWRWSRGSKLVTGPLGSVAGEPDRRQRQLLCLLPVQVAGARQARRCVCSAHRPFPQMQVQATAAGVTPGSTFELLAAGKLF